MAGNSFGKLFTVTTFGESHGPALGCVVDGCPPGLELDTQDMQRDLDSANIPAKLKPVLAYAEKLTTTPNRVSAADAQAVYDAGWDERALYDTVVVCALFNFMNRLVEGTGCSPAAEAAGEDEHEPLMSYLAWGEEMGFA